ncbi:MAG: hypothetical protein ACYC96_14735 [Fimbriimonadaceae bacterium]
MDSAWAYGIVPKTEPGLESLSEWLSGAMRRHKGTRWGIWGGFVGGSSGIAGGMTGAIAGVSRGHAPAWEFMIPWALWLAFAAAMTLWLVRAWRSDENVELRGRESTRVITMLANARARGKMRSAVGEEVADHLNEGAKLALRCRGLLESPAMRFAADSGAWSRAAERVRNAMDAGMIRLLVLATNHGDPTDMLETIAEMKAIVDELADSERRHAAVMATKAGNSDSLRSTLQELRDLSKAEDEAMSELRISS